MITSKYSRIFFPNFCGLSRISVMSQTEFLQGPWTSLYIQNLSVEFPQCNVIWAVKNPCTFWEKCVLYLYSQGLVYWRNGTLWGNFGIEGFLPGSKRPPVELTHRTVTGILRFCPKIMRHLCLLNQWKSYSKFQSQAGFSKTFLTVSFFIYRFGCRF